MTELDDSVSDFIRAASVPHGPGQGSHAAGTLARAQEILAAHPEVAAANIHTAALLGDAAAVRTFVAANPAHATAKGGPDAWDPLTHLCFSRYLRLDKTRSDGFVRSAAALLDAGADPNTGWWEGDHQPEPEWESALYGAAGIARHPELTRLLLERGADPNDGETPYHAPETYDNAALYVLVESGKLNDDSLATILLRKTDWHDHDAIAWLLEHGADPNRPTHWGNTALHNAILSDNRIAIIELLLRHGAIPTLAAERPGRWHQAVPSRSAVAMAARRGRADALDAFARHGFSTELDGVDGLIAACARADAARAREIAVRQPALVRELLADGGTVLAEFAGNDNADGVGLLLDLGIPVDAPYVQGDGYFGIAPNSTALQVASWRAAHRAVQVLIARGAAVNAADAKGRTPLALAVKACVDSYWMGRRSPDSVAALLAAGASAIGIQLPTGYGDIDRLLEESAP